MTTSDQPGSQPLTRKQLREMRLTGTTPIISEEDAAAAKVAPVPSPAPPVASAPEPEIDPETGEAPLTRRRVRQQELIRTASVPVIEPELVDDDAVSTEEAVDEESVDEEAATEMPFAAKSAIEWDVVEPVVVEPVAVEPVAVEESDETDELAVEEQPAEADLPTAEDEPVEDNVVDENVIDEAPVVNPEFGKELFTEQSAVPAFTPSFDELITSDSGGSQNLAPNTLIFTPSAGEGSLSGPVASTGEILVTGSYELPRGIGSQGHAHGTADGKEADAVLIDGELPPASSPTPIAASAAVSTIKPAGEVIRPPAPEKGNKLMLTLAITAGGLALVLAAALVIAFTSNVF
ncbi:hypothetical protein ACW5CM_08555 [Microbacterium sp. A588]